MSEVITDKEREKLKEDLKKINNIEEVFNKYSKKANKIFRGILYKSLTLNEAKEKVELLFIRIGLKYKTLQQIWLKRG